MQIKRKQKKGKMSLNIVLFQKYAFEIATPHENSTNFLELNTHCLTFQCYLVASFIAKVFLSKDKLLFEVSRGKCL